MNYAANRDKLIKMAAPSESAEQIALFSWAFYAREKYPELNLLYHIPNGGQRCKTTAKRLKAEGVKKGVPDIHLPVARGNYHGLYIEMKKQINGRLSDDQEHWISALQKQGYHAIVCRGWEEASKAIVNYLEG